MRASHASDVKRPICIKFPVGMTQIERISLTKAEVKLVMMDKGEAHKSSPVFQWGRSIPKQIGKFQGFGVSELGYIERAQERMTPDEMKARIKSIRPEADGYLTVWSQHYSLSDGFTKFSLTYDGRRGWIVIKNTQLGTEKIDKRYFLGPKDESVVPLKVSNFKMSAPFSLNECVLGKYGHALVSPEWLLNFIKDHAELVADPFNWQDEKVNPQDDPFMFMGHTEDRKFVIIREE